jgi:hypothetical protein
MGCGQLPSEKLIVKDKIGIVLTLREGTRVSNVTQKYIEPKIIV